MAKELKEIKGEFVTLNEALDQMLEEGNAYKAATETLKGLIGVLTSYRDAVKDLVEKQKGLANETLTLHDAVKEKSEQLESRVDAKVDCIVAAFNGRIDALEKQQGLIKKLLFGGFAGIVAIIILEIIGFFI